MTTELELASAREHLVSVGERIARAVFECAGREWEATFRLRRRSASAYLGIGLLVAAWGARSDPATGEVLGPIAGRGNLAGHVFAACSTAMDHLPAVRAVYVAASARGPRATLKQVVGKAIAQIGAPMLGVVLASQSLEFLLLTLVDRVAKTTVSSGRQD